MANGELAGSVRDIRTMMPIENASIDATPEGGGDDHSTTSAPDGTWSMSVPAGIYDVVVTASHYDPGDYPAIFVIENVTTELPFALHPQD